MMATGQPDNRRDQHAYQPVASRSSLAWRVVFTVMLPLLAGVTGWALLHTDLQAGETLVPRLFHQWTGLYCIGCGATRALSALLRGRLITALSYNAFAMVWLFWPIRSLAALWLQALTGRVVLKQPRDRPWLLWSLLISALLFVVLRNLPFMPFSWLAP